MMINPPNHYIVFDGQNLAEWGLYISGDKTFGAPERDVDEVEIPVEMEPSLMIRDGLRITLWNTTLECSSMSRKSFV